MTCCVDRFKVFAVYYIVNVSEICCLGFDFHVEAAESS